MLFFCVGQEDLEQFASILFEWVHSSVFSGTECWKNKSCRKVRSFQTPKGETKKSKTKLKVLRFYFLPTNIPRRCLYPERAAQNEPGISTVPKVALIKVRSQQLHVELSEFSSNVKLKQFNFHRYHIGRKVATHPFHMSYDNMIFIFGKLWTGGACKILISYKYDA